MNRERNDRILALLDQGRTVREVMRDLRLTRGVVEGVFYRAGGRLDDEPPALQRRVG